MEERDVRRLVLNSFDYTLAKAGLKLSMWFFNTFVMFLFKDEELAFSQSSSQFGFSKI